MNLDKYIKWDEIWRQEISLPESIVDLIDNEKKQKITDIIRQFVSDEKVDLLIKECCHSKNGENIIFVFAEFGGINESDTHGWSRDYTFVVNFDFMIIDAEYSQG